MEQERQQEIRGLFQILEQTAEMAEDSALTENYKDGESRCISQFNKVLKRLNELNAIPNDLFEPLHENASYSEISIACNHLAAYLNEGLGSFPDLKGMMTNILGKRVIENIEGELKEGKIGDLIRHAIPEFMTETVLDDINESFNVSPDGRLLLDIDFGTIDIQASESDTVNVVVHRAAKFKTDRHAGAILKDFQVNFNPKDSELQISAKFKDGKRYWKKNTDRLNIHFDITVPHTFHGVYLKTAAGDISVHNFSGAVQSQTNSGELQFENITGPIFGNTVNGDIRLVKCQSDVRVGTLRGDIEINDNIGSIDATTSGGNVRCVDVEGEISGETSGGNIKLIRCKGGTKVETSGGSIDLENDGPITAITFGGSVNAGITGQLNSDSTIEVSGGDITVSIPLNALLKVDALSSGGEVVSELQEVMVADDEHISGQLYGVINGDGPLLKLRCIGGDINLKGINVGETTD